MITYMNKRLVESEAKVYATVHQTKNFFLIHIY